MKSYEEFFARLNEKDLNEIGRLIVRMMVEKKGMSEPVSVEKSLAILIELLEDGIVEKVDDHRIKTLKEWMERGKQALLEDHKNVDYNKKIFDNNPELVKR